MNLLDVIVSMIVIGLLTAFFATIPGDTYRNLYQAERITQYSTVANDVSDVIDLHMGEDPETWLDEELEKIRNKYNEEFGYNFELEGEVVIINDKEFFRIRIKDRLFEQEYHYARIHEELYE